MPLKSKILLLVFWQLYPNAQELACIRPCGSRAGWIYDRVEYTYNRQGERVSKKDQNETVHHFDYDRLGRVTADRVTAVGSGVDVSVRRIERAYEVRGMVAKVTSYDAATGGGALDQVVREYDTFGQLFKEYQEHAGAKDASSLYVQYNRAGADDALRLESVRYPNGRLLHYTYGTADGMNDVLNRLDAIQDDNGGVPGDTLSAYTYLGLSTIVVEDYAQPDVKLDYWGGTSGTYAGFDRFGRVVDQAWTDYGADPDGVLDQFRYGYDRAGNRLWKENVAAAGASVDLDELYAYDGVYQLASAQRGALNGSHDAIGSKVFAQAWGLDATGNWATFDEDPDGDGDWDLQQTRTANAVNELTVIGATEGTNWADPAYDRAGNMTSIPKPSAPTVLLSAIYDAWNRLVQVADGEVVIARFRYDGDSRRILKGFDTQAPSNPDGLDLYEHVYLSDQQVIETRQTASSAAEPESLQPKYQHVWSPRYIDALILRDENTDADSLCDDSRLYYLADANYNVTALVDSTGSVVVLICQQFEKTIVASHPDRPGVFRFT